jgi:hypothetical protein
MGQSLALPEGDAHLLSIVTLLREVDSPLATV